MYKNFLFTFATVVECSSERSDSYFDDNGSNWIHLKEVGYNVILALSSDEK
jgi:hypothetical protein